MAIHRRKAKFDAAAATPRSACSTVEAAFSPKGQYAAYDAAFWRDREFTIIRNCPHLDGEEDSSESSTDSAVDTVEYVSDVLLGSSFLATSWFRSSMLLTPRNIETFGIANSDLPSISINGSIAPTRGGRS
eukprot:1941709-Amphidinium_carterae.2